MNWGYESVSDEVADEAYRSFVEGDFDDLPEVPVSWGAAIDEAERVERL